MIVFFFQILYRYFSFCCLDLVFNLNLHWIDRYFYFKYWYITSNGSGGRKICNKHWTNRCLSKVDKEAYVDLATDSNPRFDYGWNVIPLYSLGGETWTRIYDLNNRNGSAPVTHQGYFRCCSSSKKQNNYASLVTPLWQSAQSS